MRMQDRLEKTLNIWGIGIAGIVFGSLFTVNTLGPVVLGLVFMIVVATIVVTGFIWQWGVPNTNLQASEDSEKAKRERMEAVLRRLSDTELQNLRDRVARGNLSDDDLNAMIEDEGKAKRY
jgi:uncharacterized membrane protein